MNRIILSKTCFFVVIMTNHLFCGENKDAEREMAKAVAYSERSSYPSNSFHAAATAKWLDPRAFEPGSCYLGAKACDNQGFGPLHYLAQRSDTKVEYIQFLLDRGANPCRQTFFKMVNGRLRKGEIGDTPYQLARVYRWSPAEEPIFDNQWSHRAVVDCLFASELERKLAPLVEPKKEV